jgi:hypothetical protein
LAPDEAPCGVCGEYRRQKNLPDDVPIGPLLQLLKADLVRVLQHWLLHAQAVAANKADEPPAKPRHWFKSVLRQLGPAAGAKMCPYLERVLEVVIDGPGPGRPKGSSSSKAAAGGGTRVRSGSAAVRAAATTWSRLQQQAVHSAAQRSGNAAPEAPARGAGATGDEGMGDGSGFDLQQQGRGSAAQHSRRTCGSTRLNCWWWGRHG